MSTLNIGYVRQRPQCPEHGDTMTRIYGPEGFAPTWLECQSCPYEWRGYEHGWRGFKPAVRPVWDFGAGSEADWPPCHASGLDEFCPDCRPEYESGPTPLRGPL